MEQTGAIPFSSTRGPFYLTMEETSRGPFYLISARDWQQVNGRLHELERQILVLSGFMERQSLVTQSTFPPLAPLFPSPPSYESLFGVEGTSTAEPPPPPLPPRRGAIGTKKCNVIYALAIK